MNNTFDTSISPLLDLSDAPRFDQISENQIEPAFQHALDRCRKAVNQVLEKKNSADFKSVVEPLETVGYQLERVWAPVSHLNSVANNDALREAHNTVLDMLTAYWSELGQNRQLYDAYRTILNEDATLDSAQKRLLELAVRNFELAGVGLPDKERQEFTEIKRELSQLQSKFEENVLDCSNAWQYLTSDVKELDGLPDNVISRAKTEASNAEKSGWKFNLDYPTFDAIMSNARSEKLRKLFYDAWVTRASTAGPHDEKFDNTTVIKNILKLRQRLADLLELENYAEYSLALKMADSGAEVEDFLQDLAASSRPAAKRELKELEDFAGKTLNPWDLGYYSERLRESRFSISDEILRPYFPLERALAGLFSIVQKIFDIQIKEITAEHVWHSDVRLFEVSDNNGAVAGRFYTDLFARPKKRGGAWMAECIGHNRIQPEPAIATAFLVCNFMPPEENKPALLTHDEVVTLFHEFGHTLHMLLSTVPYPGVAGINGVPWDAVELPSQFLENFAWQESTLNMISQHYETGDAMPHELFERLLGSRTFLAGMQSVRQLEFALFDIRLHRQHGDADYETILDKVRREVTVVPTSQNNRFANAFSHIFAGGYAAGYYSYKWAEVLSADAFSAFEETAVLDAATGSRFRKSILERGGAVDAMEAFVDFRGRKPTTDALIRHNGLDAA